MVSLPIIFTAFYSAHHWLSINRYRYIYIRTYKYIYQVHQTLNREGSEYSLWGYGCGYEFEV